VHLYAKIIACLGNDPFFLSGFLLKLHVRFGIGLTVLFGEQSSFPCLSETRSVKTREAKHAQHCEPDALCVSIDCLALEQHLRFLRLSEWTFR
jgi:hypothetical protein